MSTEGVKISLIDKSSGLLQGSLALPKGAVNTYYYPCRPPGAITSITSNISVIVQEVSNDQSNIIITTKGVIETSRKRLFLGFPTGSVISYTNCASTGEHEKRLLQSLSKF